MFCDCKENPVLEGLFDYEYEDMDLNEEDYRNMILKLHVYELHEYEDTEKIGTVSVVGRYGGLTIGSDRHNDVWMKNKVLCPTEMILRIRKGMILIADCNMEKRNLLNGQIMEQNADGDIFYELEHGSEFTIEGRYKFVAEIYEQHRTTINTCPICESEFVTDNPIAYCCFECNYEMGMDWSVLKHPELKKVSFDKNLNNRQDSDLKIHVDPELWYDPKIYAGKK